MLDLDEAYFMSWDVVMVNTDSMNLYYIIQLYLDKYYIILYSWSINMWCDQAKWVWTRKEGKKCWFSFSVKLFNFRAILCWKPNQNCTGRSRAILVMLKTIKYKENWIILLAVSQNHY